MIYLFGLILGCLYAISLKSNSIGRAEINSMIFNNQLNFMSELGEYLGILAILISAFVIANSAPYNWFDAITFCFISFLGGSALAFILFTSKFLVTLFVGFRPYLFLVNTGWTTLLLFNL